MISKRTIHILQRWIKRRTSEVSVDRWVASQKLDYICILKLLERSVARLHFGCFTIDNIMFTITTDYSTYGLLAFEPRSRRA